MLDRRAIAAILICLYAVCAGAQGPALGHERKEPIVIGTGYDYPPYSFIGKDGRYTGYNVDLTRAVAREMELDVEITIRPWAELRQALMLGEINAIAGMYYSEERDKQLDFSAPFTFIHNAVFVRGDGPKIKSENDLRGKDIIVMRGDIMHDYVLEQGLSENPALADTAGDVLKELASGEHDCALIAKLPGLYWLREMKITNVKVTGPLLRPSQFCFAVAEGDSELLLHISEGLALLAQTGEQKLIYDKWLGNLEPQGIPTHKVLTYIAMAVAPFLALFAIAMLWSRTLKRQVSERTKELSASNRHIEHLNRILAAIRNVNQLITHEKDSALLLQKVCELLIETHGFEKAWIIVLEDKKPVQPLFQAGFNSGFEPLAAKLAAGELPLCSRLALENEGVQVMDDPKAQCPDFPLNEGFHGKGIMAQRLEHQGRLYGVLCVSLPKAFARDKEEHALFAEVGNDVSFALWSLETMAERESIEKKYAAVLANTSYAAMGADTEGKITVFNPGAEKLFGYRADEVLGTPISRLCPEDLRQEQTGIFKRALKSGTVQGFETERLTKDGQRVPVEITLNARFDEQGRPLAVNALLRDITERKRAREILEGEVRRREILMDQSSDGIVIIDQEHRVVECNRRFAEMLGYSREEVLNLHTWDYEATMTEHDIRNNFADLSKINAVMETAHRRKDGTTYDAEVSANGTEVSGQKLILCIVRDITERKQAEAQIHQAMEKAEAASRSKSEFLANMSHEIRTPLNGILGMLQLLKTTGLDNEQKDYADQAINSSQRLTRLLSDILDLSRIEAGRLEIAREPVELKDIMDSISHLFIYTAREKGLELSFTVDPQIPKMLCGDSIRLQQVLNNLVGNAIKFTDSGSIKVEATSLPPARPNQDRVLFSVTDTGIGISDESLTRLFEPFTQAESDFRRRYQGAGLGLAIAKRLVALMGGSLSVESEKRRGTTFYFSIPFQSDVFCPMPPRDKKPASTRSGLRVLLAEDEKVSEMVAVRLLEKAGCQVTAVEHGGQVLEALRRDSFDVVFMDVQMPVMDGVEATMAIRSGQCGKDKAQVPIIAVTAYAMDGDKEKFIAAGMNDYLAKPIDMDSLCEVMARVTGDFEPQSKTA